MHPQTSFTLTFSTDKPLTSIPVYTHNFYTHMKYIQDFLHTFISTDTFLTQFNHRLLRIFFRPFSISSTTHPHSPTYFSHSTTKPPAFLHPFPSTHILYTFSSSSILTLYHTPIQKVQASFTPVKTREGANV